MAYRNVNDLSLPRVSEESSGLDVPSNTKLTLRIKRLRYRLVTYGVNWMISFDHNLCVTIGFFERIENIVPPGCIIRPVTIP